MTVAAPPVFDLVHTYVQLDNSGGSQLVEDTAVRSFLDQFAHADDGGGFLVGSFEMTGDWPVWEVHSAGDELVCCLSGEIDFVLEIDGEERVIRLRPRGTCVVPRGVWHRAIVHTPGETLHITPCAGNRHRPFQP